MKNYDEFYLIKAGNYYGQYMLVQEGKPETLAIFYDLHTAELTVALLNQMLEEQDDN